MSSSPPLDETRDGFFRALADSGYVRDSTITVLERNAQGDIPTLSLIISEFLQQNVTHVATVSSVVRRRRQYLHHRRRHLADRASPERHRRRDSAAGGFGRDAGARGVSVRQRQAITLLMATLRRPELLLLDEHTAALDPRAADQIIRITDQVVREHALTTLMVTHSMEQALEQGTRTVMMQTCSSGSPSSATRSSSPS